MWRSRCARVVLQACLSGNSTKNVLGKVVMEAHNAFASSFGMYYGLCVLGKVDLKALVCFSFL